MANSSGGSLTCSANLSYQPALAFAAVIGPLVEVPVLVPPIHELSANALTVLQHFDGVLLPGGGDIDPTLGVDLVLGGCRALPGVRAALLVSMGFGGANAAIVLGRWDES